MEADLFKFLNLFEKDEDRKKIMAPARTKGEAILEEAKFTFPEDRKKPMEDINENLINYIKKPMAKGGITSTFCAFIGLIFLYIAYYLNLFYKGSPDMTVSALGFSSFLFSASALWFGLRSFKNRPAKYWLSFLGVGIGGIQFVIWITVVFIGYRA